MNSVPWKNSNNSCRRPLKTKIMSKPPKSGTKYQDEKKEINSKLPTMKKSLFVVFLMSTLLVAGNFAFADTLSTAPLTDTITVVETVVAQTTDHSNLLLNQTETAGFIQ